MFIFWTLSEEIHTFTFILKVFFFLSRLTWTLLNALERLLIYIFFYNYRKLFDAAKCQIVYERFNVLSDVLAMFLHDSFNFDTKNCSIILFNRSFCDFFYYLIGIPIWCGIRTFKMSLEIKASLWINNWVTGIL